MKIAIDNGHGLNTPGKRTPFFPDGTQIREWQFNYPTALKLGELLMANGFEVIFVSPGEDDTLLATRAARANQTKADFFISIHYNAHQGVWGSHGGIETYYYSGSVKGQQLATVIHEELIQETGLRNRGFKSANFQVLRETTMPAVLVECGFMDNLKEAKLMLQEEYQWKCARALAKGICRYAGREYVEPVDNTDVSHWAADPRKWAMEQGITDGTRPKNPVTREEVWTILYRLKNPRV